MKYVYKCDQCENTKQVSHPVTDNPIVICPQDDTIMRRAIQPVLVNWNGLPPHMEHFQSPIAKEWVNGIDRRRDAYNEKYGKNVTG